MRVGEGGQSNREDGSESICQFRNDSQISLDEMPLQFQAVISSSGAGAWAAGSIVALQVSSEVLGETVSSRFTGVGPAQGLILGPEMGGGSRAQS